MRRARTTLVVVGAGALVAAAALAMRPPPSLVDVPAAFASAPVPPPAPASGALVATAAPASTNPTTASNADAVAPSASASAPDAVRAPIPFAAGHSTESSERPSATEWKTAPLVEPTRRSPKGEDCRVFRVREWIKVHCDGMSASITQLAGDTEDVSLWVAQKPDDRMWEAEGQGAEAVFPLRQGDRRVFQRFEAVGGEYGGFGLEGGVVIDARWLEIEKGPRLVLR